VVYLIQVVDFSLGRNPFSMSVAEKVELSVRKRQIGIKFIKELQYKKAQKVFEKISSLFDVGNPTESEKTVILKV